MVNEMVASADGLSLARDVRAVAAQARLTLKRPSNPADSREILVSIGRLERAADSRSSESLSRWLSSLRRCIERHGSLEV